MGLARYAQLAALGMIAATANSGTGIGWGVITVPVLLSVFGLPVAEAVALSVLGASGYLVAVGSYRLVLGGTDWVAAGALTLGSLIGGIAGAALVTLVPELAMKRVIGLVTVGVGLTLLFARK